MFNKADQALGLGDAYYPDQSNQSAKDGDDDGHLPNPTELYLVAAEKCICLTIGQSASCDMSELGED